VAAPIPNVPSTAVPRQAPPSVATSVSAVASIGPEQGLHTMPSSPPSANAPPSEPAWNRDEAWFAPEASGAIMWVKRSFSHGTNITTPNAINSTAPAMRM